MDCRDPGGANCTGTQTYAAEVMTLSEGFFEPLVAGDQKASLANLSPPFHALRGLPCLGSFSVVWHIRHIEGPPWLGSCRLAHPSLKGAPWVGSCSVILCVRHLMGQPLYCSDADAGVWGERGYGDGSTLYA